MQFYHGINVVDWCPFYNAKSIDYAVEKLNFAIAGVNLATISS
jgi:hypothetical protein